MGKETLDEAVRRVTQEAIKDSLKYIEEQLVERFGVKHIDGPSEYGWLVESKFGPHLHYIGVRHPHTQWRAMFDAAPAVPQDVAGMVERVARAICLAEGRDPDAPVQAGGIEWPSWHEAETAAKVAIQTLSHQQPSPVAGEDGECPTCKGRLVVADNKSPLDYPETRPCPTCVTLTPISDAGWPGLPPINPDGEEAAARIEALEREIEGLREAVEIARDKFDFYADLHKMKCTADGDEKADRNREMADRMRTALTAPSMKENEDETRG